MSEQKVLLYSKNSSSQSETIYASFLTTNVSSPIELSGALDDKKHQVCVIDLIGAVKGKTISSQVSALLNPQDIDIPVVVLAQVNSLSDKVEIYDIGVDDLIDSSISSAELIARCRKAIYHNLAMLQISSKLTDATKTARDAIVNSGELETNIEFFLAMQNCDNIDQLGQLFFSSIQRYGLSCSLQMRSTMAIKNMEPTGMAKDLVSQLLTQLKDDGRFLDLGRRTIINFERISLLIKNMPEDNPEKYNSLKDNVFALVQGLNARTKSLEDKFRLVRQKKILEKLSTAVTVAVDVMIMSCQGASNEFHLCSKTTKAELHNKLKKLHVSEIDKKDISDIVMKALESMSKVFHDDLNLEDACESLKSSVLAAFEELDTEPSPELVAIEAQTSHPEIKSALASMTSI